MSTIAMSLPSASISDTSALNPGSSCRDGVVEINLLLPAQWADDSWSFLGIEGKVLA